VYVQTAALPASGSYGAGQAFWGTYNAAAPGDTIGVRYMTAVNDGVILCTGITNTALAPVHTYTNLFAVIGGQLTCALDGAQPLALVNGVQQLQVWYGVKRTVTSDYNVDTYLTATQMNVAGPNGNDWNNVSTVKVRLTFVNPLANQPGQPATVAFERVVAVMARAGVHT